MADEPAADLNIKGNDKIQATTSKSSKTNVLKPEEKVEISSSTSQDKLTSTVCKKTINMGDVYEIFPLLKLVEKSFISESSMKVSQSNRKLYQIYPNPEELCDDCRWLVKATKSSDSMKSSSEDDEFISKYIGLKKSVSINNENSTVRRKSSNMASREYGKEEVSELLGEVHCRLLECNIILTTQKLQKKLRRPSKVNEGLSETSLKDECFDQIKSEEDTKEGASKLCLVLERLLSKYLKCDKK